MKRQKTGTASASEAELLALEGDFEHWRVSRSHVRAPFPLDLLERAQDLARRAPKLGVFHRLKLNTEKVEARLSAAGGAKRLKRARARKQSNGRPTFVEIPALAAVPSPVVVTIDRGGGVRFRIELDHEQLSDAARIVAGFIRSMP